MGREAAEPSIAGRRLTIGEQSVCRVARAQVSILRDSGISGLYRGCDAQVRTRHLSIDGATEGLSCYHMLCCAMLCYRGTGWTAGAHAGEALRGACSTRVM